MTRTQQQSRHRRQFVRTLDRLPALRQQAQARERAEMRERESQARHAAYVAEMRRFQEEAELAVTVLRGLP